MRAPHVRSGVKGQGVLKNATHFMKRRIEIIALRQRRRQSVEPPPITADTVQPLHVSVCD